MGITLLTGAIVNLVHRSRRWEGQFRVDIGVADCRVPAKCLSQIGIEPVGLRKFELAVGEHVTMQIGVARVELAGELAGGTVIFAGDEDESIIGLTALQSLGMEVDPVTGKLFRRRAVRLKATVNYEPPNRGHPHV